MYELDDRRERVERIATMMLMGQATQFTGQARKMKQMVTDAVTAAETLVTTLDNKYPATKRD